MSLTFFTSIKHYTQRYFHLNGFLFSQNIISKCNFLYKKENTNVSLCGWLLQVNMNTLEYKQEWHLVFPNEQLIQIKFYCRKLISYKLAHESTSYYLLLITGYLHGNTLPWTLSKITKWRTERHLFYFVRKQEKWTFYPLEKILTK